MKAVLLLLDTLTKKFLPPYGDKVTVAPNFSRLAEKTMQFEQFYCCSMPCMPARREMHTGRPNFLHRSWSPLEPFDSSVIRDLAQTGVYTHIVTDHFHYWEVGGSGYLNQYNSMELVRGQQGDPWTPIIGSPDHPANYSKRTGTANFLHDWANRQKVKSKEDLPCAQVFRKGEDFLHKYHAEDNWFLTIESFSPHEPFFTTEEFTSLYEENYIDKMMVWPDYGRDTLPVHAREHLIKQYRAMVSMVDHYVGKILDCFDNYNLWQDTALIVYTDHGFLLGEHGYLGKNVMAPYEELTHLPFFLHDPRHPEPGQKVHGLANSLNLAPTLADLFRLSPPKGCLDKPLSDLYRDKQPLHDAVMFGYFGAPLGVTDGEHVLVLPPAKAEKGNLFNYTLSPQHMRSSFSREEMQAAELIERELYEDSETWNLLKIPAEENDSYFEIPKQLFSIPDDPEQQTPLENSEKEIELREALCKLFSKYNAPTEMYARFGLES